MPRELEATGLLGGKLVKEIVPVVEVAAGADYLPRTWARLEIDRLVAEGAEKNRGRIVELSKAMYVMSPFTSLLVLENEEMYAQYKVDRGRKDHWAMYDCPAKIPVVHEPLPGWTGAESPAAKTRTAEEVLRTIWTRGLGRPGERCYTICKPVWERSRNSQRIYTIGKPVWESRDLAGGNWHTGATTINGGAISVNFAPIDARLNLDFNSPTSASDAFCDGHAQFLRDDVSDDL